MNTYLFFDIETTGILNYQKDLSDPSQPRIVQLAALLMDEDGKVIQTLNALIKPDGWTIPEEVTKIHGITTQMCEEAGQPMAEVLAIFNSMKAQCTTRMAYNINFDKRMLLREEYACGIEHSKSEHIESICVMDLAKQYCNIAPTDKMMASGRKTSKAPKLQEAYKHFFGQEFDNAHNAMADVEATAKIFFRIQEMRKAEAA